jgi:hypothetical protein
MFRSFRKCIAINIKEYKDFDEYGGCFEKVA